MTTMKAGRTSCNEEVEAVATAPIAANGLTIDDGAGQDAEQGRDGPPHASGFRRGVGRAPTSVKHRRG